jgi:toxin ParE1/3/4
VTGAEPRTTVATRPQARQDIQAAVAHYRAVAGEAVAMQLIAEVEQALDHLAAFPDSGSPRYGIALGLDGLRCWPLRVFPYLVFYVASPGLVDVWTVLHQHRDLPASLGMPTAQ